MPIPHTHPIPYPIQGKGKRALCPYPIPHPIPYPIQGKGKRALCPWRPRLFERSGERAFLTLQPVPELESMWGLGVNSVSIRVLGLGL